MYNILRTSLFSLFLLSSSFALEQETPSYTIIEDKASVPILNPSLSERKVAKLKLANNLQVYLISDPGAEQSAAALSVEAGSWQDPKEYPGMAHFLEHMLFMGTEAYPKEFEYMQFITDHGGMVNASTWPDRTIYMFSVNNEAFSGALDRFSHFFIDPLFSPSCINRELHAVDQEHAKNIENDNWREYMVFKETGNPAHPNAAFSTGNAKTLSGIPQAALKKWYQEHYSAGIMHLVMISPLSLEKMTELSISYFSKIPDHHLKASSCDEFLSSEKQKGHITYLKPIKDIRVLSLSWELPKEFAKEKKRKAFELISYALNHEGENSLLEELKREKIAESLRASADRFGKNELLFKIEIELTQQGISQIDTALLRCFQALANLKEKGIPAYLYDEMKQMSLLKYQYQSRENAFDMVMGHARDLVDESLETYPEQTVLPTIFDPEYISQALRELSASSCMITVQADPKLTNITTDKKEKWMNAEYAVRELPATTLNLFASALPHPRIDLPPSNPYIPHDLSLVSSTFSEEKIVPVLLANEEMGKVYFAQDHRYGVPELAALFNFKSPLIDGSTRAVVLTDLYLKALSEKLSSVLYLASAAGLELSFYQKDLKLGLSLHGYNEKAPLLLKEVSQSLKSVSPAKDLFEIYKQSLLSEYDNASKELPVKQAIDTISNIIYNDTPTSYEKMKFLKQLSYEEFLKFSSQLFKTAYIEGMIYGNAKEETARSMWSDLKQTLAFSPFPIEKQVKKQVLVLPERHGPYMLVQNTPRQGNGVLLLIQEGTFSHEQRAAQQMLSKALSEAFFDTLRTKQQTAYFAKSWDLEIERQLLQFFAVQSSTHHPRELIARFELFLEDFNRNYSEKISPERFETIQSMLVKTLQMPPENLSSMAARLNILAFDYEGDFEWFDKRIASVKALSYEQLKTFAHRFLSRENPKRIAVLVEGVVAPENDFHYEEVSKEDICDIGTYSTWR